MTDPDTTEPRDEDAQAHDEADTEDTSDAADTPSPDDEDTEGHKIYRSDVTIKHDIQPLS